MMKSDPVDCRFDDLDLLDALDRIDLVSELSLSLAAWLRAWLMGRMVLEKSDAMGMTFAARIPRFCSRLWIYCVSAG
jgi:hypothetical protein